MDFKNVPKKYRPIPFWSWNDKLDTAETAEQIKMMHRAGIGGFFMHARGGLQTEYMGDEWFDNVSVAINEAKKHGMYAWAYDENGWPSGFGNGAVNGMGVEYQQKYLRMEKEKTHTDTYICKSGEHNFYYDINPFYVDTLDKKIIAEFIKFSYEPYYEKYKNEIEGFFTDEPQISRDGIPWSFVFEDEYENRYGEKLTEHLEELFLPVGDYKNTRVKFWKMVTDLFSEAFMKQVYDWCSERGLKLTGHLVLEETLETQLTTNGACMPHYEYLHIPGMDWLGRDVFETLTPMQVSSVAQQLGKESVLSETFALCGHNVSFDELKGMYEWQMVHGINLLCQHLQGYSLRGIRKRDYPPAMYYQQPWWCEYDKFNDAISRAGMILNSGIASADVLVLHPQTTAWSMFDNGKNKGLNELNEKLLEVMRMLERKHILYHLGDETIMERHARVEEGQLVIGKQKYSYVIDPGCEILFDTTVKILDEFKLSGGKVITADELAENDVVDNPDITYTKRSFDEYCVHYFVNTSSENEKAEFKVRGKKLDIYTGELSAFSGKYEFEPWESLMIIDDGTTGEKSSVVAQTLIKPEGKFKVRNAMNCLTLDFCDYYFDGKLQEKNGYVLNICERANELGKPVSLHQEYRVNIEYIPDELYLVCETPEVFEIRVNGTIIDKTDCGYFADKSFRKIEVSRYMKLGENIISFDCVFKQQKEFYENLQKAKAFESEKNKLVYDMEIEAIYLVGEFSVRTDGMWSELSKNALRYEGGFVISEPKEEIELSHIEQQGFPFFSGELELEGEIKITGENPVLCIDKKGINAVKVEMDGETQIILTGSKLPLKGHRGRKKIKLTLINNLRNMLGPHHLAEGESYWVSPAEFFKEPCVWNGGNAVDWDKRYCFVETGI